MYIAYLKLDMPHGAATIVSVGHSPDAATTGIPEVLEAHGNWSQAQIGKMLDRVKVREASKRTFGHSMVIYS